MKFLLFPGRGIGVKGPRKAKSFRTNGGNGVFSLRPSEKLQLANAKASWKRTRFRPINEYSRIQATFNERCNLLALLRTRSSCGFQLIGPTIFDWHRDWQRAERDAIFGRGFTLLFPIFPSFMEALWILLVELALPSSSSSSSSWTFLSLGLAFIKPLARVCPLPRLVRSVYPSTRDSRNILDGETPFRIISKLFRSKL